MKPQAMVKASDLVRLRNEYERLARDAESRVRQPGKTGVVSSGQAHVYRAVAADLNDLINGKGHPSARRS